MPRIIEERDTVSVPISERNDYVIHLKYAHCLAIWSKGLTIASPLPRHPKADLKLIENKAHLMELTRQSIRDDFAIVMEDPEYSLASVLWLPSKSYYLLYHLVCVIEYVLTCDPFWIRNSHKQCLARFISRLRNGNLVFSCGQFNEIFDKAILDYKSRPGEILRTDVADDVIHRLLMKKVAKYKIEDDSRQINRKTKTGRQKYNTAVSRIEISILDFFYSMRIKSAYKNFSFVDGIEADGTKQYFERYYELTENFYECLNNLKNDLIVT